MKKVNNSDDTWGTTNGMSGPVEYEFDEMGNMLQMTLINPESGRLFRRITYEYDEFGGCIVDTYGPNNILLYSLTQVRNEQGYLSYVRGYDWFKETLSSVQQYTGGEWEQIESQTLYDYRDGVDNYWICHYSGEQVSERNFYFKDGAAVARQVYTYLQDGTYEMEYQENGLTTGYYIPIYDREGRVIELRNKNGPTSRPYWTYTYDGEGRLLVATYYDGKDKILQQQERNYSNDGKLKQCRYFSDEMEYIFKYEKGDIVFREGITQNLGEGDIGCMKYEYYKSGAVKYLMCYGVHRDPILEDLKYIYSFYEDGSLKSQSIYENTENFDEPITGYKDSITGYIHHMTRKTTIYQPDGEKIVTYIWRESTPYKEGRCEYFYYNENGKRTKWQSQSYQGEIPSNTELKDLEEVEKKHVEKYENNKDGFQ